MQNIKKIVYSSSMPMFLGVLEFNCMQAKTTFLGKNPFTGISVTEFDPASIVVSTQKMPKTRQIIGKYHSLLSKLSIGESLVVPIDELDKVAQALRSHIKKYKKPGTVKAFSHHPTPDKASVFYIAKDTK
tara:strand:+ start:551 stop:940 length:390 start_codon:yes stop_codon:yes gene_type:complete